jgi:hypothetical protein
MEAWTTEDELEYIDDIGNSSDAASVTNLSRRELINKYIKALNKRRDWLNINRKTVLTHAVKALKAER